jgi:hypothetical protein
VVIGVGTCRCEASATLVRSHVRKPKDHTSGVELASTTNRPFLRQTPFGARFEIQSNLDNVTLVNRTPSYCHLKV